MSKLFLLRHPDRLGGLLAAICLVCSGGVARATLLAYEPFEYGDVAVPSEGQYAVGNEGSGANVLGGQNPTIGPTSFYTGPWIQSGGDTQVVKALPSYTYNGFPAGVGGIQEETLQFDCCSFGRTGRPMEGSPGLGGLDPGRTSATYYESFLINFGTQGTDAATDFGKRAHELWNGGVGDGFLAVELFLNHFSGVNELSLAVTTGSGTQTIPVGGGGLDLPTLASWNNGVHLVVMKYEFNPSDPDAVTVYLDPLNYDIEPQNNDGKIIVAASDLQITHHGAFTNFTFSGSGHVPGGIDEIRWGTAYADVAPLTIPEPASLALVGLSVVGLMLGRRR